MRWLTAIVSLAFIGPRSLAGDKDEDRAKETAIAFLKAVKSKDAEQVLKTADLPFLAMVDGLTKVFEKAEELKADLKAKLETIKDADKVPTEIARIAAYSDLKDRIKQEDRRKAAEKVMGGGGGFGAFVKTPDDKTVVILVRMKDGKPKVVGFGQE